MTNSHLSRKRQTVIPTITQVNGGDNGAAEMDQAAKDGIDACLNQIRAQVEGRAVFVTNLCFACDFVSFFPENRPF